MLAHLRPNAVAYVALFVALTGTSYAAIKLPANSVGTKQIRKTRGQADLHGGGCQGARSSRMDGLRHAGWAGR
jgi:hypothetical protein